VWRKGELDDSSLGDARDVRKRLGQGSERGWGSYRLCVGCVSNVPRKMKCGSLYSVRVTIEGVKAYSVGSQS